MNRTGKAVVKIGTQLSKIEMMIDELRNGGTVSQAERALLAEMHDLVIRATQSATRFRDDSVRIEPESNAMALYREVMAR